MNEKLKACLRTRRGIAAITIAVILTLLLASASGSLPGVIATLLIGFPILLALSYLLTWLWEHRWERRHRPTPSPFTRQRPSTGLRTTLRQDRNAHFLHDARGFLWRRRVWFEGTGCPPVEIPRDRYQFLAQQQQTEPVLLASAGERHFWWWQDAFYWENEGYTSRDVMALVTRSRLQKERQLQHAHALLDGEAPRLRAGIPEDVRRFVWNRDGGQCQECGSTEMLQYDHIIPWSLGGADTAENLRLLCAECNRLKSDSI